MLVSPGITAALFLTLSADALVNVEGTSSCPERTEVARHLERLILPRPADVEPDRALIEQQDGAVQIALMHADGIVVGEKRLALHASCAEMAEAIALVIAIWERPLRPGLVSPFEPLVRTDEARAPLAAPAEMPGERVITSVPENAVEQDRNEAAPSPVEPRLSSWRFEGGAAIQSQFPHSLPGALLEGVLRRALQGWGIRVAFGAAWWTETDVGSGGISWTRLTGGLGLIHGWEGRLWFLDLREQAMGAALVATGRGFDQTETRVAFDPGFEVGVRPGISLGRSWRVWLDIGLAYWPLTQRLRIDGVDQTVDAAPWVGSLSLGGTFLTAR